MSIQTQIDRISSEVASQSSLISQLASSLYSITGNTDYHGLTTGKLTDNTTALQAILTAVKKISKVNSSTVTPSTMTKMVASQGSYIAGSVYVAGDADLVADNIRKDVDIFGVKGTYVPFTVTDDGAGNVTVVLNNATVTHDGNGNVTVTST